MPSHTSPLKASRERWGKKMLNSPGSLVKHRHEELFSRQLTCRNDAALELDENVYTFS
jgi:hypothetical protein